MATEDNTVTIGEKVAVACHASNLRDEADRASTTDILKALAWSKSRVGAGLMRLESEFSSAPKPKPASLENLIQMAIKHKQADKRRTQKECETLAKIEAAQWFSNEKALFSLRLKTLPSVVQQLAAQAARWQINDPMRFSLACVGHWLDSVCPKCEGVGKVKIANTPSTSAKNCSRCRGTGRLDFPFGRDGQKMAQYIDECINASTRSIRERLSNRH